MAAQKVLSAWEIMGWKNSGCPLVPSLSAKQGQTLLEECSVFLRETLHISECSECRACWECQLRKMTSCPSSLSICLQYIYLRCTVDVDISFQRCETRQVRGGENNSMSKGRPKSIVMWDISNIPFSNQYYSF